MPPPQHTPVSTVHTHPPTHTHTHMDTLPLTPLHTHTYQFLQKSIRTHPPTYTYTWMHIHPHLVPPPHTHTYQFLQETVSVLAAFQWTHFPAVIQNTTVPSHNTDILQDSKNIKNVTGCRDGMPKSM